MTRTLATTLAATLLTAYASPALAQSREQHQVAADLRIIQERSQEMAIALDRALAQLKDLAQLAEAVKSINSRLETLDLAMRKSLADQKVSLDAMGTELRVIKERGQDLSVRVGTLTEEVDALSTAVSAIGTSAGSPPPDGPPADAASADAGASTTAPPATAVSPATRSGLLPTRLWTTAWADYTSGSYPRAIENFRRYLAEFPKYDRADDAQFYIGESHMALKQTREAVAAYTSVVQSYPSGDVVPDAYYRLGEAQRALGEIEAARASWETVAKKYPDSNGGILASQRLQGLPSPAAPAKP